MKGILPRIVTLLLLFVFIVIMGGLHFVLRPIIGIEALLGLGPAAAGTREVTIRTLLKPTIDDSALLTFLEMEYNGISMKRILTAVAIQENTKIWIDGGFIDAEQAAMNFLGHADSGILKGRKYLLKIREPEIVIAKSLEMVPARSQKVSTELFLLDGSSVSLVLYTD